MQSPGSLELSNELDSALLRRGKIPALDGVPLINSGVKRGWNSEFSGIHPIFITREQDAILIQRLFLGVGSGRRCLPEVCGIFRLFLFLLLLIVVVVAS